MKKEKKKIVGVVLNKSGNKSVKMTYQYKRPHSFYRKEIKMKTVLYVHDEDNLSKPGDVIEVEQCRPLSKMKRWSVSRVLAGGGS